jgi:MFS family permease
MLLSVLIGGLLVDALYRRNVKWTVWIPAISLLIAAPFAAAVPLASDFRMALIFLIAPALLGSFYLAPAYSLVQGLAGPSLRATAASLLLFCVNLVGFGAGPLIVGVVSDAFASAFGVAHSLRYAVLALVPFYILGALHFFLAARTLDTDLRAAVAGAKA